MAKTPNEIFRDYVADGVPSSGPHNPVKREIREYLNETEDKIAAAALGLIRSDTLAGLNAAAATRDMEIGQPGEVTTGADKGAYSWNGATFIRVGDLIDPESVQADVDAVTATVNTLGGKIPDVQRQSGIRDRFITGTSKNAEFFDSYAPTFKTWAIAINPPDDVQSPSAFGWQMQFETTPGLFLHRLISRPLSLGNGVPGQFNAPGTLDEDIELDARYFASNEVMADAGSPGLLRAVRFPVDGCGPFTSDKIYWSIVTAFDFAANPINIGVAKGRAKINDTIDPIWRRGVFATNPTSPEWVAVDQLVAISLYAAEYVPTGSGADVDTTKIKLSSKIEKIQQNSVSSSAWGINLPEISIDIQPVPIFKSAGIAGQTLAGTDKVSNPANSRYDLLVASPDDGTLLLVKGTERAADSFEYKPEPAFAFADVAVIRTDNGGTTVIETHEFKNYVRRGQEAQHLQWLEDFRNGIPNAMRKVRRDGSLRLVGYGDSITAVGGGNAMPYEPDGSNRDLVDFLSNTGSDFRATVPTFSRIDEDGQQHLHAKIGANWYIKDAIEARGCIVDYKNMGIAGTKSDNDTVSGIGPNGTFPQRLQAVVDLQPDLINWSFGMNEIPSTETFQNFVNGITFFKNAGIEVFVTTCQRPHRSWAIEQWWLYQTRQAIRAANACRVPFVNLANIFADTNMGAIGLHPDQLCGSSGNHPMYSELQHIGRYSALPFGASKYRKFL